MLFHGTNKYVSLPDSATTHLLTGALVAVVGGGVDRRGGPEGDRYIV